jgi:hypothetical protein
MYSFTLENLKRDIEQDNLYNLFIQTYIDKNIKLYSTTVSDEENMRLDKISKRIFGYSGYIEELMQINNILNIWNIKSGDQINYSPINDLELLKQLEKQLDDVYDKTPILNKKTRIDSNRQKGVPPTIKPKDFKSIVLDKKKKTITIKGKIS